MVCLLTAAYVRSTWCSAEVGIAQSRGSRLVPVQAEPGVRHPLLGSVQVLDISRDGDGARSVLTEVLLVALSWALTPGQKRLPFLTARRASAVPEPTAAGVPL